MQTDTRQLISVSDASQRGVSALIADAERGKTPVIVRNSKPAAAVVSMAELDRIEDLRENVTLMVAVLARTATDNGVRHDLDDVAAELGIDLTDLETDDPED